MVRPAPEKKNRLARNALFTRRQECPRASVACNCARKAEALASMPWREAVTIAHLAQRYCDDAQLLHRLDADPAAGPAARAAHERLPEDIADTLDALLARWSEPVLAMLWPHAEAELTIVGGQG